MSGPRKRCLVAYATRERQYLWTVELDAAASVADALAAARRGRRRGRRRRCPGSSAAVGIFGEPCARSAACADGDRIELYRPLTRDPRERAAGARGARAPRPR